MWQAIVERIEREFGGTLSSAADWALSAALLIGVTRWVCPVPCDGSTTTGKCEMRLISGTTARAKVLRTYVSCVRIPRSHSMTLRLPCNMMYSAAKRNSCREAHQPRFNRMGLSCRGSMQQYPAR